MKQNIKKASVKFFGTFVVFLTFDAEFCLCPKSMIITTLSYPFAEAYGERVHFQGKQLLLFSFLPPISFGISS